MFYLTSFKNSTIHCIVHLFFSFLWFRYLPECWYFCTCQFCSFVCHSMLVDPSLLYLYTFYVCCKKSTLVCEVIFSTCISIPQFSCIYSMLNLVLLYCTCSRNKSIPENVVPHFVCTNTVTFLEA